MNVLFIVVIAPVFFFLIAWVAATTCRICFSEKNMRFETRRFKGRRFVRASSGTEVPVGAREIRESQRRRNREQASRIYYYAGVGSEGVPDDWVEDLWHRRN